jgi:hypothetical protein
MAKRSRDAGGKRPGWCAGLRRLRRLQAAHCGGLAAPLFPQFFAPLRTEIFPCVGNYPCVGGVHGGSGEHVQCGGTRGDRTGGEGEYLAAPGREQVA